MECAIQFAGMQCQIQFNDHVETKHKPGFIEYALLPLLLLGHITALAGCGLLLIILLCMIVLESQHGVISTLQLECGPMPNVMAALLNIGGALCSTPQSLPDAHY